MEEKFVKTLKEEKGKYLTYRMDEVIISTGKTSTREILLHPGAVVVAALTEEQEIVMVRQYRYAAGQILLELPAGKLEAGEDPLECARRELSEETGFEAEEWEKLTEFYTAPGYTNEMMHLYLARGLQEKKAHPDTDEVIEYEKIPLARLQEALLETGGIKDAKSIIGLFWVFQRIGVE
ncbi:MAG: NUDIX hydrolase [Clostridia bacterium]|nr:NUDIX hydrolase [Clostridia bacterium]